MDERCLSLVRALAVVSRGAPDTTVMEVCGTHTVSAARCGLRAALPQNVHLVSGPGCPVCVTPPAVLARALALAARDDVTLFSFGDMLRVPVRIGAREDSLLRARGLGRDVRVAISPMDALRAARELPSRQVVWLAVGFETTAPLTAALILRAKRENIGNLTVLCAHKTMPGALRALLAGGGRVGALMCPGHVAAVTGAEAFRFVPQELGMPAAVAGFAPAEMLTALTAIMRMRAAGAVGLENAYPSVVSAHGNKTAQAALDEVFAPCGSDWRGLGRIPASGLAIREDFAGFDAERRFAVEAEPARDAPGCRCADVLRGDISPRACPLFGAACSPGHPVGPCMVSQEGACAAEYRYGE